MDLLSIHNVKAKTCLGINNFEQAILTDVILNLTIKVDTSKIAKNDDISSTVDYDDLTTGIIKWLSSQKTKLLETLVDNTTAFILNSHDIHWIKLSITKVAAINNLFDVTITTEKNYKQ